MSERYRSVTVPENVPLILKAQDQRYAYRKINGTPRYIDGTQVRGPVRFRYTMSEAPPVPAYRALRDVVPVRYGKVQPVSEPSDFGSQGPRTGKVMHMVDNYGGGYRFGPEARVVLHRHAGGEYAVAVVADEGPFTKEQADAVADALREKHGGWVTKTEAAARLQLSERQVDVLRSRGMLASVSDITGRVMIPLNALRAEIERRTA